MQIEDRQNKILILKEVLNVKFRLAFKNEIQMFFIFFFLISIENLLALSVHYF